MATPRGDANTAAKLTGGLVVLEAVYGVLERYKEKGAVLIPEEAGAVSSTALSGTAVVSDGFSNSLGGTATCSTPGERTDGTAALDGEAVAGTSGSSSTTSTSNLYALDPTTQWMRVTRVLQYMVQDGSLVLHPGVPKSGLMGFGDPCPGAASASRQLYVAYMHRVCLCTRCHSASLGSLSYLCKCMMLLALLATVLARMRLVDSTRNWA